MTEKKRRIFSVVDWCLLGAILVCGIGIWYAVKQYRIKNPSVELRYTIRISDVDPGLFTSSETAAFPVGCEVRSQNGTATLGIVTDVRQRPHRRAVISDGKILITEWIGHTDMDVTIQGTGSFSPGDGLRLSDVRIAAGCGGAFRIGDWYIPYAVIIDVQEEGAE